MQLFFLASPLKLNWFQLPVNFSPGPVVFRHIQHIQHVYKVSNSALATPVSIQNHLNIVKPTMTGDAKHTTHLHMVMTWGTFILGFSTWSSLRRCLRSERPVQLLPLSRSTEHLAIGTHEYAAEPWNPWWAAAGAQTWEVSDMSDGFIWKSWD